MANSTPQPLVSVLGRRDRAPLVARRGACDPLTAAYQLVPRTSDMRIAGPTTGKIAVSVRYDDAGLEWAVTLGRSDIGVGRGRGQRDVATCPRFQAGLGTARRPVAPGRGACTGHARCAGRRARPIVDSCARRAGRGLMS
jgi:hypothetical protein